MDTVRSIADAKGATPAQVALAWVLAQGDDVVPIPGTKRVRYLEENVGALDVVLTAADLERLSDGAAVGGGRPLPGHEQHRPVTTLGVSKGCGPSTGSGRIAAARPAART